MRQILGDLQRDLNFRTPFKGKDRQQKIGMNSGSGTKQVSDDEDDDEDDTDDEEEEEEEEEDELLAGGGESRPVMPSKSAPRKNLPQSTTLVADSKDFGIGDFMVLKNDADRDGAPIWR